MKKNRGVLSAIVLMAMASASCAQTSDKNAVGLSTVSRPELRWRYESGG
jgi:hypothetical protein